MKPLTRLLLLPALVILPSTVRAADPGDGAAEKRLRETLRSTLLQLRSAEADKASLLAAKAELESSNKALAARVDTLSKEAARDKESSLKSIDSLTRKGEEKDHELAKLRQDLSEWKDGFRKAADIARAKEAERARLAVESAELKRLVADRERKNLALFRTAGEILERYRNFSFGNALSAREPFVGTTRVKLENLVQGYADRLDEGRVRPVPQDRSTPKDARSASPR